MTIRHFLDKGLRLREYPEPILRRKCVPIIKVDDDVRALARAMFDVMYEYKGIGLAAPQVGLPLRMFVANPTGDASLPNAEIAFINPEYAFVAGTAMVGEACLSLMPLSSLTVEVKRHAGIHVKATGLSGEDVSMKLSMYDGTTGVLCSVVQHEMDHLDGVLYIDHVPMAFSEWVKKMQGYMEAQFNWAVNEIKTLPSKQELEEEIEAFVRSYGQ